MASCPPTNWRGTPTYIPGTLIPPMCPATGGSGGSGFVPLPPPGGTALTVKDLTGTPSYANTAVLQFVGAEGFSLTQPTAGTVTVDLLAATASQTGVVTTTSQQWGGAKQFVMPFAGVGTGYVTVQPDPTTAAYAPTVQFSASGTSGLGPFSALATVRLVPQVTTPLTTCFLGTSYYISGVGSDAGVPWVAPLYGYCTGAAAPVWGVTGTGGGGDTFKGGICTALGGLTQYAAVTPTGSTQGTAAALPAQFNTVTSATPNLGVVLAGTAPQFVYNAGTAPENVYPPVGYALDGGATNAPVSVAPGTYTQFVLTGPAAYSSLPFAQFTLTASGTGLTATGTTQGTALPLQSVYNQFATVAAGTGALLAAVVGTTQTIVNNGANPLAVYPPSGGAINGGTTNAPYTVPTGGTAQFSYVASGTVTGFPQFTLAPGPAPTGAPTLSAAAGNAQVVLTITLGTGATNTYVYRNTTGSPTNLTGTLVYSGTGTSFTDTTVSNGTTYYYVGYGVNNNALGPASAVVNATPASAVVNATPAAPLANTNGYGSTAGIPTNTSSVGVLVLFTNTATFGAISGWTNLNRQTSFSGSSTLACYYKTADGSTSQTLPTSGAYSCYYLPSNTTADGHQSANASSTSATAPALSSLTGSTDTLLCAFGADSSSANITNPGTLTNISGTLQGGSLCMRTGYTTLSGTSSSSQTATLSSSLSNAAIAVAFK